MIYRLCVFIIFIQTGVWGIDINSSATAAVIMNADTLSVLYEKNAHEQRYPASLTKIATVMYALEAYNLDLESVVECPKECLKKVQDAKKTSLSPPYFLQTQGTHFWIKDGEQLPFIDLLYGTILASGNDCANVIAHHTQGSIEHFMVELNQFLKNIGCKHTVFLNPHGLHHPRHTSTAYDLALIASHAIKNPVICDIASKTEYTRKNTNLQTEKFITTKNALLLPGKFFYAPCIGLKTGYHSQAGYTYISAASYKQRKMIVVLLGCTDYAHCFQEAIRCFETVFNESKESRCLFCANDNLFSYNHPKKNQTIFARLLDDIMLEYYPSEEPNLDIQLDWDVIKFPIMKGDHVGYLNVFDENNNLLTQMQLLAEQDCVPFSITIWVQDCIKKLVYYIFFSQQFLTMCLGLMVTGAVAMIVFIKN